MQGSFRGLAAILTLGLAAFVSAPAYTQSFKVGTGITKLTYSTHFKETKETCNSSLLMDEVPSTGATENVENLIDNKINGAYTQLDTLFVAARNRDLSGIKVLYVLGEENIHFIVNSAPMKVGGYLGGRVGGSEVNITELPQLKGMKIAAGGGARDTAKLIRLESEVAYEIVEAKDAGEAYKMLQTGKVDGALIVAAQGSTLLKEMPDTYRMLAIPEAFQNKLKGAYMARRVTYKGIAPNGTPTVAIQAVLAVRDYKTPKMVEALNSLRSCVFKNLDEIKERTGTHPSWQLMKVEDTTNFTKWPVFGKK